METIVQRLIPERHLHQHAIYMQTCAHIELTAWHIVQAIEGFDRENPIEVKRFVKMKLSTTSLLKALEAAVGNCRADLSDRLLTLVGRMKFGLENRNFAAHAAIYWDHLTQSLAAEHYFRRVVDGEAVLMHTLEEKISDEAIQAAIEDADSILLEAISIRAKLELP